MFAIVVSLLALPAIVVCAGIAMTQVVGLPFGMSLLFSVVGGTVATGFLIPEVYGWMRRHI